MRKHQFVITRPGQETLALVYVETLDKITSSTGLQHRIIAAVTRWMRNTKEGYDAFIRSCQDFNIGDLSIYQDDGTLKPYLESEGIHKLEIDTSPVMDNDWMFDTLLYAGEIPCRFKDTSATK